MRKSRKNPKREEDLRRWCIEIVTRAGGYAEWSISDADLLYRYIKSGLLEEPKT